MFQKPVTLLHVASPFACWLLVAPLSLATLVAFAGPTLARPITWGNRPAAYPPADTAFRAGIRGQVLGKQQQPLEFTTVLLRRVNDSTLVSSLLSDEQGRYVFADVAAGRYYVQAKQLGYRDGRSAVVQVVAGELGLRLPPLVLVAAPQELAEVQVTGQRPPIERQIDRMVVHVDKMPATAGGSAYDVIKGAPGVTVTGTDAITMQGKSGVLVLIDDRPVRLTQDALLNMLRNMPAESIESLEVITTPPARYDAEGNAGIINIRTRQRQQLGWNTDLTLRAAQGHHSRYSGGAVAAIKRKAVDLSGSYFAGRTQAFENITQYATQLGPTGQPQSGLQSASHSLTDARYQDGKVQLDVKASPKISTGLVGSFSGLSKPAVGTSTTLLYAGTQPSDTTIQTLSNTAVKTSNYSIDGYYSVRLDSVGRTLSADANYTHYRLDQRQNFFNQGRSAVLDQPVGNTQQFRGFLNGDTYIRSLKADLVLPLRWAKVETGVKYSAVKAYNDFQFQGANGTDWQSDPLRTNQFEYHETTFAAYGSAGKVWEKLTVQLGLRAEYTRTLGVSRTTQTSTPNNYFKLFPTAYVQYKATPSYQTNLSYSRRIARPAYSSLNPFLSYQSQFFSNQGNPFLQPSFTDAVEWSNLFKESLNVAPFFNYTSHFASEYPVQNAATRETIYTFGNLGYSYNYGVTVIAPFSVGKRWKVDNNVTVYEQSFRSTYAAQPQQSSIWVYNLSLTNSFTVTPRLSVQLAGYYNSPTIQGFYHSAAFCAANAGATLKLLQDKASLSLSLADIFYTERGKADVHYANQDFGYYRRNDTRLLRLTFTYKLGATKLTTPSKRNGAAQEERNRAR